MMPQDWSESHPLFELARKGGRGESVESVIGNLTHTSDKEFIQKLTEIVEAKLGDEKFRVKELAQCTGVNQSYLSRRLHKISNKSASMFIMEVRLRQAMEILRKYDVTAAEAAYKVGFGSTTYFNKCFREHYGFPPGEV